MKIPFESVLQGIKNIEERNVKFNSLPKAKQRQEIAYDCLKLIISGRVHGSYREYWSWELMDIKKLSDKEFQEKLNYNLPVCDLCARGGMMLSQIRLGNSISCNDYHRVDGNSENIKGFTIESFVRMEKEYERMEYGHPYDNNTTEKLANICCNVIKNKDFNTKDKTDYLKLWEINL